MILRTPLIPFRDNTWLKLESLQPIGSFKIRGATRAVDRLDPARRAKGVVTASAGNFAQGLCVAARAHGVAATIIVPDTAPRTKLDAIERLGGRLIKVPFDRWWSTLEARSFPGVDGPFIHPTDDDDVIAGNGAIGVEIVQDLPGVEQILVPWGGGGLAVGIAKAVKCRVVACEVATAAPLTASLAAGRPVTVERIPSFVDGIGGKTVFPRMFEMAKSLLAGTRVAPLDDVKAAVRELVGRGVVAEGAGAVPVACLRQATPAVTVCVVSGGNIDAAVLRELL